MKFIKSVGGNSGHIVECAEHRAGIRGTGNFTRGFLRFGGFVFRAHLGVK